MSNAQRETPAKPLLKQKFNPAVGGFPAHQNAVGVNPLYFNNFLFRHIGRLVGWKPTIRRFFFKN
ncbi:MAG: hypothetical protein IK065_06060 [Neisseriaceae bacterium]|nr:hypothetical protein [Neisseriaceae bacterium]